MSLPIAIQDPANTSNRAGVDSDGFLYTMPAGFPPGADIDAHVFPYRQQLTLNGVNGASYDMRVDGSVTNQIFSPPRPITANGINTINEDLYITTLSVIIADPSPSLSSFGAKTAMVNGCLLQWVQAKRTTVINPALKSNWDFVRMALGNPAWGATTNSFYASNVVGTSEAYIPIVDLTRYCPPWGIKLSRHSAESLQFIIRDNLFSTGTRYVVQFDIIAVGFSRV